MWKYSKQKKINEWTKWQIRVFCIFPRRDFILPTKNTTDN